MAFWRIFYFLKWKFLNSLIIQKNSNREFAKEKYGILKNILFLEMKKT
jgi:hypothetical protein